MLFFDQNMIREMFKSEPEVFRIVQETDREFPGCLKVIKGKKVAQIFFMWRAPYGEKKHLHI